MSQLETWPLIRHGRYVTSCRVSSHRVPRCSYLRRSLFSGNVGARTCRARRVPEVVSCVATLARGDAG